MFLLKAFAAWFVIELVFVFVQLIVAYYRIEWYYINVGEPWNRFVYKVTLLIHRVDCKIRGEHPLFWD